MARKEGNHGKLGSLLWVLDAAKQTRREAFIYLLYLLPAGNLHTRPGTTSTHCVAVGPAMVQRMGSAHGGQRRQLCGALGF